MKKKSNMNANFWLKGLCHFLSLLDNAEIVISNLFHAVACSLIFNKQFLFVKRKDTNTKSISGLFLPFDIPKLIINYIDKNFFQSFKSYESIKKSKTFLKEALN